MSIHETQEQSGPIIEMLNLPRTGLHASQFFSVDPLSQEEKKIFLDQVWPTSAAPKTTASKTLHFDAYFAFLNQERNSAVAADHAITNYDDLFFIVSILQNHGALEFRQVIETIQYSRPSLAATPSKLTCSIELVLRLWLMINIRNRMPTNIYQLQTSLPWQDNSSLSTVLAKHITRRTYDQSAKFSEYLNFYDMNRIGGFRVEWTNNLALHLTMKGSFVYVFHGVSVLKRMRESAAILYRSSIKCV